LASLLDMNREEKEQYVIQLYKENKSTREIAKIMHMSFRNIGAITKKVKLEADRGRGQLEEDEDIKSKSKITQAIKLFSELKTPVEVVIALDLPSDQVQAMYQEYWELEGMYRLAQIYEEAKYDLPDLLALHRIVKGLGMEKHDIKNVLEIAKNNQLEYLQPKVKYLKYEISMLETERTRYTNQLFRLNRMIAEYEETLAQKRAEMAYLNRETRKLRQRIIDYNSHNLRPTDSEPDANSDSTQIVPYNKE
jgi:uncharacterized coiled-coil protein SlyX